MRGAPSSRSATGISTGPELEHLESPVRTSDTRDPDHLFPINLNETPKGSKAGGSVLKLRPDKGRKLGEKNKGEVTRTPTHQPLINPTDKTKTTNPPVRPQQAGGTKSPPPLGVQQPKDQADVIVDNSVARKLFKMAAEVGPQIRMPWFQGKPEEKIERYFRELERLKVIYTWDEPKTLNMALHGQRGRADVWAHGLPPGEKDTFAHLKAAMSKIFGDRRAVWQKQTEFFALRQGKDQTVLDFAGTIKQHQGKADMGAGTVLAVFLEGLKGSTAKQVAIQDPKTFDEAVATATRLESLDRAKPTKVSLNMMGSEHEREEDPIEGMVGTVE